MFFLGTLVPLFWISGDVSAGFQSPEYVLPYSLFCGFKCYVHSLRSTSAATHANLLMASTQPVTSLHACAEVGLGLDSNGQSLRQKTNALPLCQRPGFYFNFLSHVTCFLLLLLFIFFFLNLGRGRIIFFVKLTWSAGKLNNQLSYICR